MGLVRALAFLIGLALVAETLYSAMVTFVLPRSANDRLTRIVFLVVRALFNWRANRARSYEARDRVMALFAPMGLLLLPPVWLTLILIGYMGMFYALGISSWHAAFAASGSSLLTLGFAPLDDLPHQILAFSEATIGLALVALLIAYLPTIYAAFNKREVAVTMLEVRAGSPPWAVEMIERYHRIHGLDQLGAQWATWETWFADIDETHTSLTALVFFRSPRPDHSWITAAGAVLDGAALVNAVVDIPHDARADLCIRAGFLALRHIADFFAIPYNPAPKPDDPISINRSEFDTACERLAASGVPLKPNRDQAWRDFAGWRVNYDTPLLAIAGLTMAPYAPWSSDRSLRRWKKI
ncbi:MAG: hypothetical protein WCF84_12865 [Anaerolineae bacterium]